MGRKGGKASGKAKRESIVTISIDTVQGERYIVRGRTPEKGIGCTTMKAVSIIGVSPLYKRAKNAVLARYSPKEMQG